MAERARAANEAHLLSVARMMGMEIASKLLGGHRYMAETLSIGSRAVRAKLSGERGITYSDLTLTAKDLRSRAARLVALADKLQALADKGE